MLSVWVDLPVVLSVKRNASPGAVVPGSGRGGAMLNLLRLTLFPILASVTYRAILDYGHTKYRSKLKASVKLLMGNEPTTRDSYLAF